jgi:hypothetical protein
MDSPIVFPYDLCFDSVCKKRAASRKVRRQIGPIKWGAGIFLRCRNPLQQQDVLSFGDFNGRGVGTMSASPKHTLRRTTQAATGRRPDWNCS